jgi:hypothetical protein
MRSDDKCEKGTAFTATQRLKIKDINTQQNKHRVTITICDKQFNLISSNSLWHRLAGVPSSRNLAQSSLGIRIFNALTSMVILYEVVKAEFK